MNSTLREQQQLQAVQMNILREIDKVCRDNGITYWLAFGTAIGAVRHKGFIPWDDDIDLFMHVKDIEKFESLQGQFPSNIFIQSRRTDPEYGLMITRVRNSNTTLIEAAECDRNINHGVFVDIYPIYNCPQNSREHKLFYYRALLARLLQYGKMPKTHGMVMQLGSRVLLTLIPKKKRKQIVDNIYTYMKNQPESGLITYAYGHTGKMVFKRNKFYPVIYSEFEDMMAPLPKNYDAQLKQIYGDYMKLPPKEKQVVHHDFKEVDCTTPYIKYKGIEYCVKGKR